MAPPSPDPMDAANPPSDVTRLLHDASHGNKEAFDRLFPLVYDELKGLARRKLQLERSGHTLNATALVHEAYLKLVDQERVAWQSRAHFFALAAQAMRRILINHAKGRKRQKRGAGAEHVSLDEADAVLPAGVMSDAQTLDLLALNEALEALAEFNREGAEVVEYRFFGGLSNAEIAEVLGTSEVTVRRRWSAAKSWLRRELGTETLGQSTVLLGAEA